MLQPKDLTTTPPGDWKVVAPETGVPFRHHNLTALLSQIRLCREGMGLSCGGDWIQRVYEAICIQNPDVKCEDQDFPERIWTADDVWRFFTTLKEAVVGGMAPVEETEQMRRIDICIKCPKRTVIGCRWCGGVAMFLTEFLGDRKLPNVAEVYKQSCGACGCDLTSKTLYSLDLLKRVDEQLGTKPDYWTGDETRPKCWMLEDQP